MSDAIRQPAFSPRREGIAISQHDPPPGDLIPGERPLTILLVEDDEHVVRQITQQLLSDPDVTHDIRRVGTLARALETLHGAPIDLILLSLRLSGESGLTAYRRIQASAPEIPTVVLENDGNAEPANRAVQLGAQEFLIRSDLNDFTLRRALSFAAERRQRRHAERQLQVAHAVQRTLLPENDPEIPGYELAARMLPAAETTGDYFDFLTFRGPDGAPLDDVLGIAVGDVCGHGLGAAIMMAEIRGCLHSLALRESDPSVILRCVHEIVANNRNNYFLTIFLAALDTTRHQVTYASAGHPVWKIAADGAATCLPALACPLGLPLEDPFVHSPCATVSLAPGEGLLLPTDGIYEAPRNTQEPVFGTQRMTNTIRDHWTQPANGVIGALIDEVLSWSERRAPADDVTAILVRRSP